MSEQTMFSIGKLLNGTEDRDAIHFAVAPVEALEHLYPGQHVGLSDGKAVASGQHIGIVDPFLRHQVCPGDRFWLMLYPNTITALRHNWTHPAFPVPPKTSMSESEAWLRDYAERAGFSYERVLDAAREFVRSNGDWDEGLRYHTDIADWMRPQAAEFWRHFQAVTGQPVPDELKDHIIFWCSC